MQSSSDNDIATTLHFKALIRSYHLFNIATTLHFKALILTQDPRNVGHVSMSNLEPPVS